MGELSEQVERLISTAIVEQKRLSDLQSGLDITYVWRLGKYSGCEDSWELARAAVLRVAKIIE